MDRRPLNPIAIVAILAALVVGLLVGGGLDLKRKLFGGDVTSIARASLESMRAQNRLVPFVARYVSVVTSKQSQLMFTSERTLVLPGDVRYELDLAKLGERDVTWDDDTKTLSVRLPEIEIAGPEVDLAAAREYGSGGVLGALTDSRTQLDDANRSKAVADLRKQAQAATPMRLAREAARQAVEHSFALPLRAAGIADAKVVARFASDPTNDPSYIDRSRSYNEVMATGR
ncbi:DUF4230 domain-containing protein [Sphingomonas sp.]|jgi:hypothetical protein|uniref:DUF4230 domain-containing protein n=1 Tax=Sphingomonas sp. TaxID=28214 RepID=UPI0025E16A5B|nr:DUF4230 domain-containing protein [Sphingomonas sp.]